MPWSPPTPPNSPTPDRVKGALYGSKLFDQPEHADLRNAVAAFVASSDAIVAATPLALEIGFDHGMVLLDHAHRFPQIRWLGAEIRKKRVDAAAAHAPANALLLRADARTLLAALLPAGSLHFVYILFPTPTENPRHLLLTEPFVELLHRALAPDGQVHLATDVLGLFQWAEQLFDGWPDGPGVPFGPVLSRRERVCRRDGLPVYRLTRQRKPG
jgi:tRNA G46 methylase TrmB